MNSSMLTPAAEKRHVASSGENREKSVSSTNHMPFAWCIQASQTTTPSTPRQVVVINCPPEVYLG